MAETDSAGLGGRATAEGTATAAARMGPAPATLGGTGLRCAPLGFAAHGVRADDVLHARALRFALQGGVNVLATDGRETGGAGERLVGRVLAEAIAAQEVAREGVVVITGIDCRDAPSPEQARERLAQSRRRLALAHVDVAVLQLDAPPDAALVDWVHHEIGQGTIGAWGLSCDGFASPSGAAMAVAMLGDRERRPAALAMPLGPLQLGAAIHRDGAGPTTLEAAAAAGVAVIAHRTVRGDAPIGEAPSLVEAKGDPPALVAALAEVRKLEAAWAVDLGRRLHTDAGDARDLFRWGQLLSQSGAHRTDAAQWQRLRHEVIAPHVGQTSAALLGHLGGDDREAFARWWQAYGTALHRVFVRIEAGLGAAPVAARVAAAIDPWLSPPWRALPLPCRAVGVALAAGAATVLVGMRTPARAAELLAVGSVPSPDPIVADALASALAHAPRDP